MIDAIIAHICTGGPIANQVNKPKATVGPFTENGNQALTVNGTDSDYDGHSSSDNDDYFILNKMDSSDEESVYSSSSETNENENSTTSRISNVDSGLISILATEQQTKHGRKVLRPSTDIRTSTKTAR